MKAPLCLVLATLFWSGNFVVGQAAVESVTPLELTFWRWAFAAVPLLLLAQVVEKPDWRAVLQRWPALLLLSALGMSAYTLLLYSALGHTSALNASLITAANPALIVVLALVFTLYFSVRSAVPDLPLQLHHALADLPSESGQAANALSMLW